MMMRNLMLNIIVLVTAFTISGCTSNSSNTIAGDNSGTEGPAEIKKIVVPKDNRYNIDFVTLNSSPLFKAGEAAIQDFYLINHEANELILHEWNKDERSNYIVYYREYNPDETFEELRNAKWSEQMLSPKTEARYPLALIPNMRMSVKVDFDFITKLPSGTAKIYLVYVKLATKMVNVQSNEFIVVTE